MDFLFDFFYPRPYYYYYESSRRGDSANVGLLESFFSFVFGDGDPNHDFNSRRMQTIAEYIRSKDGVVVAEELAPFMDPQLPPLPMAELRQRNTPETRLALIKARQARERSVVDESWVLPAVLQFGVCPRSLRMEISTIALTLAEVRQPHPPLLRPQGHHHHL